MKGADQSPGEKIRRIETAIPIPAYNGAREITSLPIYPVKFGENRSLLNQLVKRGKLYYDLVKAKHPQMQYRGELLGETRALVSTKAPKCTLVLILVKVQWTCDS
jgi:hypothetical protein